MKRKFLGICECGCELPFPEGLKRKSARDPITKEARHTYFCPEHGGRIVEKKAFCVDCDVLIPFGGRGGNPRLRCDPCAETAEKARQRKIYRDQKKAKEYIEKSGLAAEPGVAYNIYICGCIVRNEEDPHKYVHSKDDRRYLVCSIHGERFLNKFKKCSCGREYLNLRVKAGDGCKKCHSGRLTGEKIKLRNGSKADPDRWDCKHRDKCLMQWIDYEAIPCKGCGKYKKEPVKADPYVVLNDRYQTAWDEIFYI